jgi:hypothetical protein
MAGPQPGETLNKRLTRRDFLKLAALGGPVLVTSCQGQVDRVVNAVSTAVDSTLRTAISPQGSTEVPIPSATEPPTGTSTSTVTEAPTYTATPERLQFNPEGVSARNQNELAAGRIQIDVPEGQRFYPDFAKALLRTRIRENDDYFRRNFGITSPLSEGAGTQFLQQLRRSDYLMPEGLTLLRHCDTPNGYHATTGTVGAFKLDTVLVAAYGMEEYAENQLHAPEGERITREEKLSLGSHYEIVLGFLLRTMREDEAPRLMLLIALPNTPGMEEPRIFVGTQNQESVNGINRFLYFYVHLLRNLRSMYQSTRPPAGCEVAYSMFHFYAEDYTRPPDQSFSARTSAPPYIVFRPAGQ